MNKLLELIEAEKEDVPDTNDMYYIGYNNGLTMAKAIVMKHDVEVVVRCKDCKYVQTRCAHGLECGFWHIGLLCGDDFCSSGERRSGDA